MTKPVVVENLKNAPGVVRVDTEVWQRGPGANRQIPATQSQHDQVPDQPRFEFPVKE